MNDISKKLWEFFKEEEILSFSDIDEFFENQNYNYKGNMAIVYPKYKNIILWQGYNQATIDMFSDFMEKGKIEFCSDEIGKYSTIYYLMSGRALDLPVAKRKYDYKKPHWFPVLLKAKRNGGDKK